MRQTIGDDGRGDTPAAERSVLVPVAPSATLRETIEYVVESTFDDGVEATDSTDATAATDQPAVQGTDESGPDVDAGRPTVHFVYVHAPEEFDPDDEAPELDDAEELLDRVRVWATEDAGGEGRIEIHTGHVGTDRYLFSPADVAASLIDAARDAGADRIVLDPEYDPGIGAPLLRPLAYELSRDATLSIEEAPVQQRVRRAPLVGRSSARRIGALAGLSFLFYQMLAGALTPFDVVTGSITAIVVAGTLSRISFSRDPTPTQTPLRLARFVLYVPYLLWEIVVANLVVAAVILDPRKEIDPKMARIEPAVYGALPVTSLANSITLTPGTLTVRVQGRELLIHTLLPASREDLFDGSLERAIRFVFYGRRAMRIDSLRERGVAEIVPSSNEDAAATEGGEGS
ncbi:monovalent cation/H+ antiporter subunit E [Salinarchaeum chitinilyticum]